MKNVLCLYLLGFAFSSFASEQCFRFFYVKRPVVMGAVEHEFVIAQSEDLKTTKAFGLLKGNEDLSQFLLFQQSPRTNPLRVNFMGETCGFNAVQALSEAKNYSELWTEVYQDQLLYYSRMGLTPILGKPCRNSALEISELIAPYLEK